ncbi:hypothetical protein ACQP2U_19760 [Nocardia sp. CA-084685]
MVDSKEDLSAGRLLPFVRDLMAEGHIVDIGAREFTATAIQCLTSLL